MDKMKKRIASLELRGKVLKVLSDNAGHIQGDTCSALCMALDMYPVGSGTTSEKAMQEVIDELIRDGYICYEVCLWKGRVRTVLYRLRTAAALKKAIATVDNILSPENIAQDGLASPAQIKRDTKHYMGIRKCLMKELTALGGK